MPQINNDDGSLQKDNIKENQDAWHAEQARARNSRSPGKGHIDISRHAHQRTCEICHQDIRKVTYDMFPRLLMAHDDAEMGRFETEHGEMRRKEQAKNAEFVGYMFHHRLMKFSKINDYVVICIHTFILCSSSF